MQGFASFATLRGFFRLLQEKTMVLQELVCEVWRRAQMVRDWAGPSGVARVRDNLN
jgi:hypothetical protein